MRASGFSYEFSPRRLCFLSLFFLSLFTAAAAPGAVEVRVTTTDHGSDPPRKTEGVMVAAGGDLAMDLNLGPGGEAGKNTTIFRGETKHFVVVDHGKKEYSVMDEEAIEVIAEEMKHAMRMLDEKMAGLPPEQRQILRNSLMQGEQKKLPTKIVKTTEVGTKAGFSTRKFEIRRGDELVREVLVADWKQIPEGDELRVALQGMESFFLRLQKVFESAQAGSLGGASLFDMGGNPFQDLSKMNGFPVLTKNYAAGELVSETETRSVESTKVEGKTFELPADYRERTMSGGS